MGCWFVMACWFCLVYGIFVGSVWFMVFFLVLFWLFCWFTVRLLQGFGGEMKEIFEGEGV